MSIKRYVADKDTTITNAYKFNLINKAEDSNMGASDVLEVFSIVGQAFTSSVEISRVLLQFPINEILEDRNNSLIPNSGSVKFFLRVFNVAHNSTLPRDFSIDVLPLSNSWDEGYGLDMESYSDRGWKPTSDSGYGCTWKYALSGTAWENTGSDYYTDPEYLNQVNLKEGTEDIQLDITKIVEEWTSGGLQNNGLIIKLSDSFEDGSKKTSFFTKRFSSRSSQYFYKRPIIEARWEAISTDDREQFYCSSSMLSTEDNIMNIYFYNKINNSLKNINNNILPGVKFYSNENLTGEITPSYINISNPSRGVYKASLSLYTTASIIYDKWYNTSSLDTLFSDYFYVIKRENYSFNNEEEYVINIINNKVNYNAEENTKFKIFSRKRDWSPNIYSVASKDLQSLSLNNLYYKIFRIHDNYTVIDYSTGSMSYTKTSYDSNGNYFDFSMKLLEPNYTYGIKLATWDGTYLKEFSNIYKFKVG